MRITKKYGKEAIREAEPCGLHLGQGPRTTGMWAMLATRCPKVIPGNLWWKEVKLQEELVRA